MVARPRSLRQLITTLEQSGTAELEQLTDIASGEIARFNRRCGADVHLDACSAVWPDSHSQEITIRSVIREALNNIAKHAEAETVEVELHADETAIELRIKDDGVGFDPARVQAGQIGLGSMHERVHFLGGSLTIQSKPGGPTTITAILPRWQPQPQS